MYRRIIFSKLLLGVQGQNIDVYEYMKSPCWNPYPSLIASGEHSWYFQGLTINTLLALLLNFHLRWRQYD